MNVNIIDESSRNELIQLIQSTKAYFPSEPQGSVFPIVQGTDVLFELDRLWSDSKSFNNSTNLLIKIIKNIKIPYTTISGLTSRTGAFGTVPICAGIALRHKKNLLVLDEERFSNYTVHPDGSEIEKRMIGEKIILIKDVVLGGDSLERACNTIRKIGADLVAIIVMVDLGLPGQDDNRYSNIPGNIPVFVIAKGPFPELKFHNQS